MTGFNIVMVIAIILFARLGVRLLTGYTKLKREQKEEEEQKKEKESQQKDEEE